MKALVGKGEAGEVNKWQASKDHEAQATLGNTLLKGMRRNAAALRWYLVPFHLRFQSKDRQWKALARNETKVFSLGMLTTEKQSSGEEKITLLQRRKCREDNGRTFCS